MTSLRLDSWEALCSRDLEEEWDGLVERSAANEVFSRLEWLRAWGRSGTRESRPDILLLFDNGRLSAIAPLMYARRKFGGVAATTLEFAGAPNSDYSDFIFADARYLAPLWELVRADVGEADLLRLQQVRRESPTCAFLERQPGMIARHCSTGLCAKLPDVPYAPVESYLKGRGLRRRTLLRIEKEGAVELIEHESPMAILKHLPILFDQHIRRWALTRTQSFFQSEAVQELYRNWVLELGSRTAFWELRLNRKPVATLFGFVHNRKLIVHTISFDINYHKLHCGLYCIVSVMRTLRERGIEWIDFSRGSEKFKLHFADEQVLNWEFHWLRSWRARCAAGGYLAAKDLARHWAPARRLAGVLGYALESGGAELGSGPEVEEGELTRRV